MKKKNKMKEKMLSILKSYKLIIFISFGINIVLLICLYYVNTNNKIYTFSGSDEYIEVKDGLISLNNDINIINGNNIKYVNSNDYDIKSYKMGYYVMDGTKLIEIVSSNLELDSVLKFSDLINNFSSFNIVEKNNNANYFTHKKKVLLDEGLYLIIEAKTESGDTLLSKIKLNMTKISKY